MKFRNGIALVAAALTLAACDTLYGVSRSADLTAPLEQACVRRVVETTPGVAAVDYRESHSGKGLFHPTPWSYAYSYRGKAGSKVAGTLTITTEYDGRSQFRDTLWQINAKPPQEAVDATRPVMRRIEAALAQRCGLRPAAIPETCRGVACPTLSE
ncbi:MAG: hypothetical protein P4L57_08420 [Rhizomicrobium sp.]|nr:hypothetical protein [Rhizomicrobium sp.]